MKLQILSQFILNYVIYYYLEIIGTAEDGNDGEPEPKKERLVCRQPSRRALTRYGIRKDAGTGIIFWCKYYYKICFSYSRHVFLG